MPLAFRAKFFLAPDVFFCCESHVYSYHSSPYTTGLFKKRKIMRRGVAARYINAASIFFINHALKQNFSLINIITNITDNY